MMKRTTLNLLKSKLCLFVILIFIVGCRKDPQIVIEADLVDECGFECEDFPKSNSWFGYETYTSGPQYRTPKYNPTNDQEFIYVRTGETWGISELVKVNLTDMSETILLNTLYIVSEPVWNAEGWIVFSELNNKIWKIKEDGSSLTQLTFGAWDSFPYFDFDGSIIYYNRTVMYSNAELEANPELYKDSKIIGINLDGVPVDSILTSDIRNKPDQPFLYQLWDQANFNEERVYFFWAMEDNYGIYTLDLISREIEIVDEWNKGQKNYQLVNNVKYHDGFVYISKFRNDLLKINVYTGENTRMICGCDENFYNTMSLSPNGDKILVERIISKVLNDEEIDEQHEIWMMDLDGGNAVKILGNPE